MELEKVIHEICSALEAIEKDNSLYEEASFGGRLEALDAIEISILPRVEGLAVDKGQAETFLSLKQRAEMLKKKLEAVDEELFHKLRAGISSGALRGAELSHQIEAYAGGGRGKRSQGRGAYDSLDALISGVLLVEPPPAEASQREAEMVFYQPTPVRIILQLVDRACFQEHDIFYDLGSGLGQVVILVHLLSGAIAKGVEVDPAYCEYARRCAQELNISGVDFIHADAREADYSDGTAFFLYTPFEGKMLQEVLARLRGEAERRRIDVYTYGPCTAEVSRQEWLRPVCQNVHRIDRLAAFTSACRHACGGPARPALKGNLILKQRGEMSQLSGESLTVRPCTLDDAQRVADLLNACAVARTGKPSTNVQSVRSLMQMPSVDLETDILLALGSEGQLAGFAFVQLNPPSPLIYALTELHPRYWGQDIGTTLCRWIEERARRAIPELEAGARIALLQKRLSTDQAGRDLLLDEGYRVVRYAFRMTIELKEPPSKAPVPEGITIRPFVRELEGRALIRALHETFRENWGYIDRGFEMEYEHWMHMLDRDPDCDPAPFWFVAMDGAEIAGFTLCHPEMSEEPGMAWVYIVGVRPAWRRRGIARALLGHSFGALYRAGKRKVSLEVDAENRSGATRLYEKAEMHVERRVEIFEKELRPGE